MKTALTLQLDDETIRQAEALAEAQGISLDSLFENILIELIAADRDQQG